MNGGLVFICVPTCMRPKMLAACLGSIATTKEPPQNEVRLLVLDNDAEKSAETVFSAQPFNFPARYLVEPQRGISSVRNRALDEAEAEGADYLAFIDDDQTLNENWLCALLEGMKETGADTINGAVEDVYPNGAPWWIRPSKQTKGGGIEMGLSRFATNFLLMKAQVFKGLRFDMRFNLTGSGDYDYSMRAARRGFSFAETGKAYASSVVPAERLAFRNHFLTQWQRQTGYVLSHRLVDGFGKTLFFFPKGLVKFCKGILYCVAGLAFGKRILAKGVKNIIAGSGLCYGVFAHGNYQKYAKIEGE